MNGHFYRAYGLTLRSSMPLPGLTTARPRADVDLDIVVVDLDGARGLDGINDAASADAQRVRLVWPGLGVATIAGGRTIEVRGLRGAATGLGAALIGQALAIVLFQRGHVVLHASAVAFDGRVVAFAGQSGAGKSTLAAACVARGAALVADDIVCVEWRGETPLVRPAYPALRLDAAAATVAPDDRPTLARLDEGDRGKALLGFGADFAAAPLPFHALFVIEDADALSATRRHGQSAPLDVLRYSYVARLAQRAAAAGHLKACARVAARVPVYTLRRPRALSALDAVTAVILQALSSS